MQHNAPQSPFESYCYGCNVSAPLDAKRCIHCGERLSRQRGVPAQMPVSAFEGADDEQPRASSVVSPMTVMWILLFIGGTLYRMCS